MSDQKIESALYIVAMPIGNLEDLSSRARHILSQVDLIASEDTRHTRKFLNLLQIKATLVSYHDGNERNQSIRLLEKLKQGQSLALVSDAGTPLISDPGYRLVRAVRSAGFPLYVVPGPSALTAALSVAGLPTDSFIFEGFLPSKAAARRSALIALQHEARTLVFFEAPHRLIATLADISEVFGGDREIAVARELSKKFESVYTGSAEMLAERVKSDPDMVRGEMVVLVRGAAAIQGELDVHEKKLISVLYRELGAAQASRLASEITGRPRKQLYQAMLTLQKPSSG